jgi:hypothetical protein
VVKRMAWIAPLALLLVVGPAQAQEPRIELQGWAGYTFSDGVSGDTFEAEDGNRYNRVDPENSRSYGFSIGFFMTENVEVGFLWDRQDSTLVASGTATRAVAPLNIDNYHGFAAYNFGGMDDPVRPYVLVGLGATRYGGVRVTGETETLDVGARSRFSTTWGLGVKLYPAWNFGIFGGVRWTPTYIKTDATGWWCDPWWGGCWVVGNAQYANQWELEGGITLRF